jgi:hypothetical protein
MENSVFQDTMKKLMLPIMGLIVYTVVEDVMFVIELEARVCFGMPKVIAQIEEWQ